jgi:hypothetical protein
LLYYLKIDLIEKKSSCMSNREIHEETNLDYYFILEIILNANYKEINQKEQLSLFFSASIGKLNEIEKEICLLIFSILIINVLVVYCIFVIICISYI